MQTFGNVILFIYDITWLNINNSTYGPLFNYLDIYALSYMNFDMYVRRRRDVNLFM
jgi:hypothetical protein